MKLILIIILLVILCACEPKPTACQLTVDTLALSDPYYKPPFEERVIIPAEEVLPIVKFEKHKDLNPQEWVMVNYLLVDVYVPLENCKLLKGE